MRTTAKLTALAAVAAMAIGAGSAQARHGADDPAGQHKGRGADDAQPHFKHGADDPAGHRRHHKARRHARRGADDRAGDQRRGRGADDGPNHR